MQIYTIDPKKQEKALREIVKEKVKSANGFIKFCYGATKFLQLLALALGLANILYVAFVSKDWLDIAFFLMTFGFPFGLSFLTATVYVVWCGKEYHLRKNEMIITSDEGFGYNFSGDFIGVSDGKFSFDIMYQNVTDYHLDDKTKVLTIRGKIQSKIYENGKLKSDDEYNEISLLDTYDYSITKLLEENCHIGCHREGKLCQTGEPSS